MAIPLFQEAITRCHCETFLLLPENIAYLRQYLLGRTQWMTRDLPEWSGREITHVNLTVSCANADAIGQGRSYSNNP